jgi:hypothetical protein
VSWWLENGHAATNNPDEAGRALYGRLEQSLDSEPEKILMRQSFKTLRGPLGDKLAALVPQVYLHYDPYTVRERGGPGPLARQRMDFLLLMKGGRRVVLEIDGKQHYSEGERPSPRLYADMVIEDRRLRLSGYELVGTALHFLVGIHTKAVTMAASRSSGFNRRPPPTPGSRASGASASADGGRAPRPKARSRAAE